MYYQYFGLSEAPFSIAVNPRYLFMSARHRDALAHLLYGVGEGGGFILLTGEVGTGKTTINRCLLEQLPQNTDIAIILNPALNALELLASVCDEFGLEYDEKTHTLKTLTDKLHAYLLANHERGRKTVLLIDEAQHLDFDVLEQIRLLTNLETNSEKLLQIILIGQPELSEILARPELRQLNQRITARYNLEALNLAETGAYIQHRLQVAGMRADREIFPPRIVRGIHKVTRGIPRVINVLCDRILLGAYGRNKTRADQDMLELAIAEVLGGQKPASDRWRPPVLAFVGLAFFSALAWWLYSSGTFASVWNAVFDKTGEPQLSVAVDEAAATHNTTESLEPGTATAQISAPASSTAFPVNEPAPARSAAALTPRALQPPGEASAQLWRLHAVAKPPAQACTKSVVGGVSCIAGEANTWDEIAVFDRPLVLDVITPERFAAEILLLEIDGSSAWVATPQGEEAVSLAQLAPLWSGGYRFLWRPPLGYRQPIAVGDVGPAVSSVANLFAQLDGQPQPLAAETFNAALQQRVRLFQRDHGLSSDGVVGLRTLLQLNDQLGLALTSGLARLRVQAAQDTDPPQENGSPLPGAQG